jgi:hypothetical protein
MQTFHLFLKGDVERLPEEWNLRNLGMPEKYRSAGGCDNAKVLHWNGNAKPYTSFGRAISLCTNYFDKYDVMKELRQNHPECISFQT